MVGSGTKLGKGYPVVAFRVGGRMELDALLELKMTKPVTMVMTIIIDNNLLNISPFRLQLQRNFRYYG